MIKIVLFNTNYPIIDLAPFIFPNAFFFGWFSFFVVRLQIPLFSEQDNFLLKRGLRIIF